jgi:hypothetical protein
MGWGSLSDSTGFFIFAALSFVNGIENGGEGHDFVGRGYTERGDNASGGTDADAVISVFI